MPAFRLVGAAASTCAKPSVEQRSATALTGESVAEFFQKSGLTAFLGKVSPELVRFTLGGAEQRVGHAADSNGPLFGGSIIIGQYRQAKAARDQARLQWQQTTLTALSDVSTALIARQKLAEIRSEQAREVQALGVAVKLSTERYSAGKASYYEVLEAQQQLFPSELDLARTQRDQLLAVVSLYKALKCGR